MAKKRTNFAIPKRVGGVKVPKRVRQGLRQFIASQSGRALAIEAVTALGAVFAAAQSKRGSLLRTKMADADFGGAATSTSAAVRFAVGEAVRTFSESLKRGKAEADARTAWPEAEEGPSKKNPQTVTGESQH